MFFTVLIIKKHFYTRDNKLKLELEEITITENAGSTNNHEAVGGSRVLNLSPGLQTYSMVWCYKVF